MDVVLLAVATDEAAAQLIHRGVQDPEALVRLGEDLLQRFDLQLQCVQARHFVVEVVVLPRLHSSAQHLSGVVRGSSSARTTSEDSLASTLPLFLRGSRLLLTPKQPNERDVCGNLFHSLHQNDDSALFRIHTLFFFSTPPLLVLASLTRVYDENP